MILLLGFNLGEGGLAEQQQLRRRGRVLEREADHFGRIDDAGLHQVYVLAFRSIEPK